MVALRCTRKLLARVGHAPAKEPGLSSTRVGDWYANLVFLRGARLVLCVNERATLALLSGANLPTSLRTADRVLQLVPGRDAPRLRT